MRLTLLLVIELAFFRERLGGFIERLLCYGWLEVKTERNWRKVVDFPVLVIMAGLLDAKARKTRPSREMLFA